MSDIFLLSATRELVHDYYKEFEADPDIFMDMEQFQPYRYDPQKVDTYYDAKIDRADRRVFYIMQDSTAVGELLLKNIDLDAGFCELSIHLKNDTVKNRGFGTQAEKLALQYAFEILGLQTVFADCVQKNARSQHVLEKVGFLPIKEDDRFKYYRFDRENWSK